MNAPNRLGGNCTLSFRPVSNRLDVNPDGEVFGMYDDGWRCTVSGRFSLIDARYCLEHRGNCSCPYSSESATAERRAQQAYDYRTGTARPPNASVTIDVKR